MNSLKILILGRSGKMGQLVEEDLKEKYQISGALNRSGKIKINGDIDLCIDFSSPDNLLTYISDLELNHIRLITGTTGFSGEQFDKLMTLSKTIPVFHSTNFSIGIQVLIKAAQVISDVVGSESDVDIIEKHHSAKKDKPSGTALTIAESIQANIVKKINQHSIRAGKIVGDHTVQFTLNNELIEISHHAVNRSVFASGAAAVIPFIMKKDPGFYTMTDFLNEGSA